jgi:hypothetical protein
MSALNCHSPAFKRKAAECLPLCRTLSDAEEHFGGKLVNDQRDKRAAAVAWGLLDGYLDRPIETGGIGEKFFSEYFDGVEIGRQVRKLV